MAEREYWVKATGSPVTAVKAEPADARVSSVTMDGSRVEGCMFCEVYWYTKDCTEPGLIKHDSDEVLVFIGSDESVAETLNANISVRIENDTLELTDTCAVFVPKGCAVGDVKVANLVKPVLCYRWQLTSSFDVRESAEATAPAGTYANNVVTRYIPPDGNMPEAPEGFLNLLLFLDSRRLKGTPYMETVWFKTKNDSGPAPHDHGDLDEFIGFVGTDPAKPQELGAVVDFHIDGHVVTSEESILFYIPRGVKHSPIIVPSLTRPIIHFSGGNGGDYQRKDDAEGGNLYKPE